MPPYGGHDQQPKLFTYVTKRNYAPESTGSHDCALLVYVPEQLRKCVVMQDPSYVFRGLGKMLYFATRWCCAYMNICIQRVQSPRRPSRLDSIKECALLSDVWSGVPNRVCVCIRAVLCKTSVCIIVSLVVCVSDYYFYTKK